MRLGKRPLSKLYSKEQRALYAAHAPAGSSWTTSRSSARSVLKLKFAPEGFGRKLVAELAALGQLHDPRAVDEMRTSEALQVAAESKAFLMGKGINLTGEQETKTKKALQYFSKQLQAGD